MAGHSKWANIKRRKASQDSQKNKINTRLLREITVAARLGGETNNARLQAAIQNAKKEDVANTKIEAAIKRASASQGEDYEEHLYEAYAAHGVALAIETMTNNNRRTVASVRSILTKYGGKLAPNNLFSRKGVFTILPPENTDLEALTLELLEAGIDAFEEEERYFHFSCPLHVFSKVKDVLTQADITPQECSLQYVPDSYTTVSQEQNKRVEKLIEALEEDDDVQRIYDNMTLEENT